jgi:hypothetical protein
MRVVLAAISAVVVLGLGAPARAEECEDPALGELAARHALDHTPPSILLGEARASGASYPSLHVITLADDDLAGRDAWMAALGRRGLGPLRCGEALDETSRVVVAAPAQGALVRDGRVLHVHLSEGFRAPIVYVRSEGAEPLAVGVEEGVALLDVESIEAPAQLQLVATGADGPRPIAELALGAVAPVDESLPADPTLLSLLRSRAGAGTLRPNRILGRVAEEHAEAVCATAHVAHELEDGLDARERLRRAHLEARHVGEVIARAGDEAGAWRALARSPSHRAAIGDRRFTDVGIARVEQGEHTCLVVVLAAWPRRLAR